MQTRTGLGEDEQSKQKAKNTSNRSALKSAFSRKIALTTLQYFINGKFGFTNEDYSPVIKVNGP